MKVRQTDRLIVRPTFSQKESTVIMHPNDGYDLGLMTSVNEVVLYRGCAVGDFTSSRGTSIDGRVFLKNECPVGTVELSLQTTEKLGRPDGVRLYYLEGKLLIATI